MVVLLPRWGKNKRRALRCDRRTEYTIHRAACSQLKTYLSNTPNTVIMRIAKGVANQIGGDCAMLVGSLVLYVTGPTLAKKPEISMRQNNSTASPLYVYITTAGGAVTYNCGFFFFFFFFFYSWQEWDLCCRSSSDNITHLSHIIQ